VESSGHGSYAYLRPAIGRFAVVGFVSIARPRTESKQRDLVPFRLGRERRRRERHARAGRGSCEPPGRHPPTPGSGRQPRSLPPPQGRIRQADARPSRSSGLPSAPDALRRVSSRLYSTLQNCYLTSKIYSRPAHYEIAPDQSGGFSAAADGFGLSDKVRGEHGQRFASPQVLWAVVGVALSTVSPPHGRLTVRQSAGFPTPVGGRHAEERSWHRAGFNDSPSFASPRVVSLGGRR
jgi:hypothetical protein